MNGEVSLRLLGADRRIMGGPFNAFAPPAIAAVTFDFWNTLVAEFSQGYDDEDEARRVGLKVVTGEYVIAAQ